MNAVNPQGNSGSLSLAEAAAAYANPVADEEADQGQSEFEEGESGEDQPADEQAAAGDHPEDEGQVVEDADLGADEPAQPAYAEKTAKVKLPDGSEATIDELIKGNLRDKDYRQKTMAHAEQERSFKARVQQHMQSEQQVAADRNFMVQLLQAFLPQRPDPSMYMHDPIGFGEQDLAYRTRKEQLDYFVATQQQSAQQHQAQEGQRLKEIRDREWQTALEVMPELSDPNRLNSFAGEVMKHASEYGFQPDEIQNHLGLDHRQILVLRDAIKWRNLQASKSKVNARVEGRPPVMRSGTRQSPETQSARDVKVAMDRLKQSGSLRDGVAALLASEKG